MTSAHIPRCTYIKTDGRRCGSPSLKTKRYCYFHYEVNRPTAVLSVPALEDGNAVQLALTDLARAVADGRIELKPAALLAYILQTASANLKRVQLGVFPDSMITDLPDLDAYTRHAAPDPAPSAVSSALSAENASASSAVGGSDPRPSASLRGKRPSVPSTVKKGPDSLLRKIEAAKAGSLQDAKELLDLVNQAS